MIPTQANFNKRGKHGFSGPQRRNKSNFKKKGRCHNCGKIGHFKPECRLLDKKVRWNLNKNKSYNNDERRYQGNSSRNNNNRWGENNNQNNSINMQGLLAAIQNMTNNNNQSHQSPPPFGGYMAAIKFRANVAEMSDEKNSDAYIDSEATHHFFHRRDSFENYEVMSEESVMGATGVTKIVGKGMVRIPIDNGIYVEAYDAPRFNSNILSVRLLQKDYDIMFSESIKNFAGCFIMRKGSRQIVSASTRS